MIGLLFCWNQAVIFTARDKCLYMFIIQIIEKNIYYNYFKVQRKGVKEHAKAHLHAGYTRQRENLYC